MFKSKEDIKAALSFLAHKLEVPQNQICLGGGGALMFMGVRESTADLNLWINNPHFDRIAELQRVTNHPMTDTMVPVEFGVEVMEHTGHQFSIPVEKGGWTVTAYIRERNSYFTSIIKDGVQIFEPLPLLIQKRGGFMEPERPLAKRQQDHRDIVLLNDLLKEKNKVRDIA